jgi:2-polyprenyl-6-methoxyphenol hydroxylase-like FAD-dependent oxidoreductase
MRHTDIAIVGGGLAGSTAAAMLGRAGHDAILIDPHPLYPKDFRCEKLDASQLRLLRMTGLADAVMRAATIDLEVWIARFGHVVEKKPSAQCDILYDGLVNAVRAEIPRSVPFIHAKAAAIATGSDRQRLTLSNGEEVSARLIVLANGLNIGLRHSLGIEREVISPCHSISIGFDVEPVGRPAFDFRALTYYTEDAADRVAYVTLFPIGAMTRANLFVYRDMDDPWLRRMRRDGQEALFALMPGLRALTGDSARSISMSARATARPGSSSQAMPSAPRAPPPGRAATRCSPMSSASATCTSRAGSPRREWAPTRSRPSMMTASRSPATNTAPTRRIICARYRPRLRLPGARGDGENL